MCKVLMMIQQVPTLSYKIRKIYKEVIFELKFEGVELGYLTRGRK